ncbi:MAG: metallopeptidase, partial [Candidatus Aenigmarchaeota archaeon]|nr:metallopeptidase [Candidatus Aenigmarchaeota archaeon]
KFVEAPDIKDSITKMVGALNLGQIDIERLFCMRSYGSKGRSIARIWSMPKIWQKAMGIKAHYVIEVVSERFDKLSLDERDRTLIHELMHIPKGFSGGLVPHNCFGKRIDHRSVEKLFNQYKAKIGI